MPQFASLHDHAARLAGTSLARLATDDASRASACALRVGPLYANFARQRYDAAALDALFALAQAADFHGAMRRLVDGERVNVTEGRAALHTALRGDLSAAPYARECAALGREESRRVGRAQDASIVAKLKSNGMAVNEISPAELQRMRAKVQPVYDTQAKLIGEDTLNAVSGELQRIRAAK